VGIPPPEANRLVETRKSILIPRKLMKGYAAVHMRVQASGIDNEGAVVARERLSVPTDRGQRGTAVNMRLGGIRL